MRNPEMEGPNYREMVMRCSGCNDQASCAELQKGCDHLDAAPSYCRNKELLEARARD